MKRFWKVAVAGAAIALVTGLSVGQAVASPPTGYGYDGTSHVIVGAGSDTTYFTMLGITDLYNRSGVSSGCVANTTIGPSLNECVLTGSPETNDLGNWQHDTVGEANPVGSSAGVASLNAASSSSYAGTVNPAPSYLGSGLPTGPNADFARSSRGPKTTGGNVIGAGNELSVDTFWGYAEDGIEIVSFNNRGTQLQGDHTGLTPNELFGIFNCTITQWSQVPSLGIAPGSATDGPIVPWGINTSSGTFATFQSYIQSNASGVPSGWSPDGQACDRKLSNGIFPFENDLKPIINDPASLSASATSTDNPENWITWGSFGDMSAFPFKSAVTRGNQVPEQAGPGERDHPELAEGASQHVPDRPDPVPRHAQAGRRLPEDRQQLRLRRPPGARDQRRHHRHVGYRRNVGDWWLSPRVHPVPVPGRLDPAEERPVYRHQRVRRDHGRGQLQRLHDRPVRAADGLRNPVRRHQLI